MKRWMSLALTLVLMLPLIGTVFAEGPIQYPIENGPTLTIWCPMDATASKFITSYNENEAFITAQEMTGIGLEFIHPVAGQTTEQYNLMIVSGDIPDIVVVSNHMYPGGDVAAVEDGVYADLTELLPDYAPAFWEIVQTNDEYRREVTTTDGRILSFTGYKNSTDKIEGSYSRVQLRKDWLEEIGMDTVRTVADYETFFQHVLDTKPGVVPIAFPTNGYNNALLIGFGLMENYYHVDGQIHYSRYEPALLDYLTVMHNWFEKGYISKDFTAASPQALFEAEQAASLIYTSVDTFTRCEALGMPVQNAPYIRQEEGQQLHGFYVIWPDNTIYTNIAADSSHIKEAMMFVNFGYTVEGANVYNYGKPGVAWMPDESGQPIYTDYILNNEKWNVNELNHILKLHSGGVSRMRYSDSFTIPDNIKNPACLAYRLQWMDDPNYDIDQALPPFKYTVEANDRHTALITDIKTYADEMILKFITGAEPLSGFDKYLETVKSMGMEEAIALTQAAYDAHMAK